MFKLNDLVVVKGQNDVMRVLNSDDYNTEVATGEPVDDHNIIVECAGSAKQREDMTKKNFDTNDLDLVTHMGVIYRAGTHKPKVGQSPSMSYQDVTSDMSKLMVQVYNWVRDQDIDKEVTITMSCSGFTSDTTLPIALSVRLGWDMDKVEGSDIWECAETVVSQYKTNKAMNPLLIPRYVDE